MGGLVTVWSDAGDGCPNRVQISDWSGDRRPVSLAIDWQSRSAVLIARGPSGEQSSVYTGIIAKQAPKFTLAQAYQFDSHAVWAADAAETRQFLVGTDEGAIVVAVPDAGSVTPGMKEAPALIATDVRIASKSATGTTETARPRITGVLPLPATASLAADRKHGYTVTADDTGSLLLHDTTLDAALALPSHIVVAISPNHELVAIANAPKEAITLNRISANDKYLQSLNLPDDIDALSFAPDGRLAIGLDNGNLYILQTDLPGMGFAADPPPAPLPCAGSTLCHHDSVNSIAFNTDGTRMVTASDDNTAIVWEVAREVKPLLRLTHTSRVVGAAFLSQSNELVTVTADQQLWRWNSVNGSPVTRQRDLEMNPFRLVAADSQPVVAVLSDTGTARIIHVDPSKRPTVTL
jgi:WD40 repeat protein